MGWLARVKALMYSSLVALLGLACAFSIRAEASAPAPQMYAGVRAGGGRNIKGIEILDPVLWRHGNLWFVDLRGNDSSENTQEYNLGIGLRHLVHGRGIVGAYAYYDHRREYGHFFDQATIGMEWLGRRFDLRANAYLPLTPARYLASGAPYLGEDGVTVQDRYARALGGFDLEGGMLVPGISRYVETRAFAGIYRFSAPGAPSINGWRTRVRFWVTRGVYAQFTHQEDNAGGVQNIASLEINIPLTRHWVRDLVDAFLPHVHPVRTLRQRLVQPPVRDVDVRTAIVERPRLIQPLIYVGRPSPSAKALAPEGTLSNPYPSVQAASGRARPGDWIRLLSGTYPPLSVPPGVTLWGGGAPAFGVGATRAPVVRSPGAQDAVTVAGSAAVLGVDATGADANHAGFRVTGSGVILADDRAYGNGIGFAVDHASANAQNVVMSGDIGYQNAWFGLRVDNAPGAGAQSVAVSGSTFTANGLGGVWAVDRSAAAQTVDMGGGPLGSTGANRLFGNTVYDLANDSGGTLWAEHDWWGVPAGGSGQPILSATSAPPPVSAGTTSVPQSFNYGAPAGITQGAGDQTLTGGALGADPGSFSAPAVQSPLIFVDTARAGSVRNGTYAHPYATPQAAVAASGAGTSVFIAPGTYIGGTTPIRLKTNDVLWGAGYRTLGLGRMPGGPFGPGATAPDLDQTQVLAGRGATIEGIAFHSGTNELSVNSVSGVVVRNNAFNGPQSFSFPFSGAATTAPASMVLSGNRFNGGGFQMDLSTSGGFPLSATLDKDEFANGFFGIYASIGRTSRLSVSRTTFATGFAGAWLDGGAIGDFGGGPLGSAGDNRFLTYSSSGYALGKYESQIYANHDWWGQSSGPTATELNGGTVASYHIVPWLTSDPGIP